MSELADLIAAIASVAVDLFMAFLQAVIRALGTACLLLMTLFSRTKRRQFLNDWRSASTRRRTTIVAEAGGCTALLALFAASCLWLADAVQRPPEVAADKPRIDWDVKDPQPTPWADRADDEPLLEVELTAHPAAAGNEVDPPQPARKRRFDITRRDYHRITRTETLTELTKASARLIKEKARQLRKPAGQAAPDEAVPVDGKQIMEEKDDGC